MRILGLLMTRNGEHSLARTLDNMQVYCDAVYVLDDRSTDCTAELARSHATVKNVFTCETTLSQQPWFFSECICRELLFRMADFFLPDWVIQLDDDQCLDPAHKVRATLLELMCPDVAGIRIPVVSTWADSRYPSMVPLMGDAKSMNGAIWKYYPDLHPDSARLHNPRLPANIEKHGLVVERDEPVIVHRGWDTLDKRIKKAELYTFLDPDYLYNQNVPYDRGLLFGYGLSEIDQLIRDYRQRLEEVK